MVASVTAALVVAMAGASGAEPPAGDRPGSPAAPAPPVPAAGQALTLITGDRLLVRQDANGQLAVTIDPAERGGGEVSFSTLEYDAHTYVIPSDAAPLVPDVLDRELFNLSRLLEYGYTDGVPVIATYREGAAPAATARGATATVNLPSIDAAAFTIDDSGQWWRDLPTDRPAGAPATARTLAGVERVWLDGQVEAALDESVPQVGAPQAWDAGYDGTGLTVAVLDTGVRADHPDLDGRVVAAEDFAGTDGPDDQHGHGTHVSGIIASQGEAVAGSYVGTAPGVELMNGKVLGDGGTGQESWIIAGMEWAAQQDADIINMSLGGCCSDGTDPMSQAVNRLTAAHDVLFVIAAGNSGQRGAGSIEAPGAADAALTVGSVSKRGTVAFNSGQGPRLGDDAIKPDMTAPGVSIVSARAEGTSMPGAVHVGDHHTTVSGTSMATPHVAGAAAILLQQQPDLSPAQLKALLASTAVPRDDTAVYRQGGGRLDIPAALEVPVIASPSPADLGYHPYPHASTDPVDTEITYTNRGDESVTLELSLEVESDEGEVPPESMLSVSPSILEVPPGGAASATLTLDVRHGEYGLYGGYLVATGGGEALTRTPVGFHKEPEMYDLTIEGIARDGRPARGLSELQVMDVHDLTRFLETNIHFTDGTATVRVPPGTYMVMGLIFDYDGHNQYVQAHSVVGDPELEVTTDTTLVLDARDANEVVIDPPAHEDVRAFGTVRTVFWREAAELGSLSYSYSSADWMPVYAAETDPVTRGQFELNSGARFQVPPVAFSVVDPIAHELRLRPLTGSPAFDGDTELPVVWVGAGEPEDYEDLDVAGKAVLSMRGLGPGHSTKEATARAHGAAALLVMNDTTGNYAGGGGRNAEIPAATIPGEDGELLRDLLDEGGVTLRMWGAPTTPSLYDLVYHEQQRIPGELSYAPETDELAAVTQRFHGAHADHEVGEVRHYARPFRATSFGYVTWRPPHERVDYLTAEDTTTFGQSVYQGDSILVGKIAQAHSSYQPGEHREQSWGRAPVYPAPVPISTAAWTGETAFRDGDELHLRIPEWYDGESGHWSNFGAATDTGAFRLYQDGELIAEATRPLGTFALSPDPAEYRLEAEISRDADWWPTSTDTYTAWTIQSDRPGGDRRVEPLLFVDYDLELSLVNSVPRPGERGGPHILDLQVSHQPGAATAAIAGARLWVSFDDGDTWRARPLRALGDGRYQVVLPARGPAGSEYVSLRVEAWDADGNRIAQAIQRAYALP